MRFQRLLKRHSPGMSNEAFDQGRPSISVVIPTYNRAPLLRRALASVICQTLRPKEIIIVDDGSDDETPLVCKELTETHQEFAVHYLRQDNQGVSAARN